MSPVVICKVINALIYHMGLQEEAPFNKKQQPQTYRKIKEEESLKSK